MSRKWQSLFDVLADGENQAEIIALKVWCVVVYLLFVAWAFTLHPFAGLVMIWAGLYIAPVVAMVIAAGVLILVPLLVLAGIVLAAVIGVLWLLSMKGHGALPMQFGYIGPIEALLMN